MSDSYAKNDENHSVANTARATLTDAERLRNGAVAGCETVRLTDAEREAIEAAIATEHERGAWQWAATLRNLLERLA